MEGNRNKFEYAFVLLGATLFGLGSIWVSLKIVNYAITLDSIREVSIFAFAIMFIVACGSIVLITAYNPHFLDVKGEEKSKFTFSANSLMIVASILVIIIMAFYIYIYEILGG